MSEVLTRVSWSSPLFLLLASSCIIAVELAEADIFPADTFPYGGGLERDLRVYLAKRGLNYPLAQEPGARNIVDNLERQQQEHAANDDQDRDGDGDEPAEVYLLEDKDYPKSVFESYAGVGQVSGITTLPTGDVVIFHRSEREWTEKTFEPESNKVAEPANKAQDNLIKNDTLMMIDGETGNSKLSLGANLFYMPHGVASDSRGNLWVTDVGRHQVMRLPTSQIHLMGLLSAQTSSSNSSDTGRTAAANNKQRWLPGHLSRLWPDIILGEAFVPGQDEAHFCKPSEVVVSSDDRLVFVADGYCNRRVMVFTGEGKYLTSFGEEHAMDVVHSLALIEERNLLCVADRENGRILCFKAGLDGDLSSLGELVLKLQYPIGRVFALAVLDADHLLVSGNQIGTNKYDLAALNPFRSTIKQIWTSSDLLSPHSLTRTKDGRFIYAADVSREAYKKVFKFYVIQERPSLSS